MWCKAGVGTPVSLPWGLVKKSDMKLLSYLYCRSTLRHSEAAETAMAHVGQTQEDTTGSPQPFALHLSKDRPRSLQKGMKAALAVLGTQQLPWCLTSTLPLLALGRQEERVYYCSPRWQRDLKGPQGNLKAVMLLCSVGVLSHLSLSPRWGTAGQVPALQGQLGWKTRAGEKEWAEPTTASTRKFAHSHGLSPTIPWLQQEEKAHCRAPCPLPQPCSLPRQGWTLQPLWNATSKGQAGWEGVSHCPPALYLWSQQIPGVCWQSELHYFWKERARNKSIPKHDHCCVTLAEH